MKGGLCIKLLLCALLLEGTAETDFRALELKAQVEAALHQVQTLINTTRQPHFAADVPHAYDDKYLLAEFATKAAISGAVNVFDGLAGDPQWWAANKETLLGWQASAQVVTLRLAVCQRVSFDRTEEKDLDLAKKDVTEGTWGTTVSKTVTTVAEHFWNINVTWELLVFAGVQEDRAIMLRRDTSQHVLKSTTAKDEKPTQPELLARHSAKCPVHVDVDLSWLLARARTGELDFVINRSAQSCRTPRRNLQVDAALSFFQRLSSWARRVDAIFLGWKRLSEEVGQSSKLQQDLGFSPILAVFSLEADSTGKAMVLAQDFKAILAEHRRRLDQTLKHVSQEFSQQNGLIKAPGAMLSAVLHHVKELCRDHEVVLDAIEDMLHQQLVAAVGKKLSSADFTEYMDFHQRRLFRAEHQPTRFSYAVRRPGHSPEGLVSIEAPGAEATVPIQSLRSLEKAPRMRFALSAATDVEFTGETYIHSVVFHQFGKIVSAERFEPTAALIVKNRDDITIPLLVETIPTPKEFRDAIESLSPEQQRFAKAFREMQLSSTLFAMCIIQIKPQLERVLNLPADSLTKQIQLTQDLMELFIKYQVPSDLLSYEEGAEELGKSKLQVVKENVEALLSTINASQKRELEEEEGRAQKRKLQQTGCPRAEEAVLEEVEAIPMFSRANPEAAGAAFPKVLPMMAKSRSAPPVDFAVSDFAATDQRNLRLSFSSVQPSAPPPSPAPSKPGPQKQIHRNSKATAREDLGGAVGADITSLPALLDRRFEQLDEDSVLRPSKLKAGSPWVKKEGVGLLSPLQTRSLDVEAQAKERDSAFDLLDALSRSGALSIEHASLHVMLAATHSFDETIINTVVKHNVNPIEKVERSVLIMASTLQRQPVAAMVAPEHLPRIERASPALFGNVSD
eukprot:TRINITY_DN21019_c1_g1_i3.p1 TRINITY_DN21019_c1_g1~~TRINITY_DN21019_c1_g1_i3.p1  ORF type:complete len:906 (-),score=179.70 TRINITY_DN21019_c1_g1_i3:176-2893(-)